MDIDYSTTVIYTNHYKLSLCWHFDNTIDVRITDENKNTIEDRNVGNIIYFIPLQDKLSGFISEISTDEEKYFADFMPYFIKKSSLKYAKVYGL